MGWGLAKTSHLCFNRTGAAINSSASHPAHETAPHVSVHDAMLLFKLMPLDNELQSRPWNVSQSNVRIQSRTCTLFNCYANWRQNIYKINKGTYLLDLSHRTASSEKWLSFSRGTLCSCVPPFECLWKRRLAKPSSLWSAVAVPVHWLQGTSFWAAIYTHWRLLEKQNRKYLKGAGQVRNTKSYACVKLPVCSVF